MTDIHTISVIGAGTMGSGIALTAAMNGIQVRQNDVAEAQLERARAYADAGAGSLFVPFLLDAKCIAAICAASPLPVNILRGKGGPTHKEFAALGVARISHGHQPWAAAMAWLAGQASQVMGGAEPDY